MALPVVVFFFLTIFNVMAEDDDSLTGLPLVPPLESIDNTQEQQDYIHEVIRDPSKRRVLDRKWSETLARFTNIEIPPDFRPPSQDDKGSFYKERFDWSITGIGEIPYAAVIFDEREQPEPKYLFEPGRACGAVLATPKRIITSCACVLEWLRLTYMAPAGRSYPTFDSTHGIGVAKKTQTLKIRLNINTLHFDAYDFFTVDDNAPLREVEQFCYECFNVAKGARQAPGEQQLYIFQHAIAILSPRLNETNVYMSWPPRLLDPLQGYEFEEAHAVGFGFTKRPNVELTIHDDFGYELVANETLLSLKLNGECNHQDVPGVKRTKNDYYEYEIACAYVSNKTAYQLCGGLLGAVVVRNGVAFGVMSTIVDCISGERQIIIRPFYQPTYRLINFLLEEEMNELHSEQPKNYFRDTDVQVEYLEYEVVTPVGVISDPRRKEGQSHGSRLTLSNLQLLLINLSIFLN